MSYRLLCQLSELTPEQGREFLIQGRIVAVFRSGDQVHAIDGMCAHQGGPIAQGHLEGKCVTCPWHGWQYDVTSGTNLLTGKQMLDCFPVEIRGNEVWIEVPSD